jgi:hypothetical protein
MTVPSNLVPTRITDLPVAPAPTASGTIPIVIGGVLYQAVFSDVAGTAEVPASRIIAAGTGLTGGGNLTQDRTIAVAPGGIGDTQLDTTGVVAGTYGSATEIPQIVVNAQGRIVGVQLVSPSFAGLVPETRNLFAGSGLLGGGNLTQDRTFSVDFSNATPQSLGIPSAGVATQPSRDDHVHPPVDLGNATQRTGILGRANGGTGENITNLTAGAVWYTDGNTGFLQTQQGASGAVLRSNGAGAPTWEIVPGTGTVSSVGLSLPLSVFNVYNSPVTSTGTLIGDFIDQQANRIFAGPSTGANAVPTFRTLVNADLQHSTTTVGTTTLTLGGTVTTLGGLTSVTVTQDPVSALELAPKQYVDAVAQGLDVKASCKYATTANLASLSGVQTVDGFSTSTGDRILVKNQNDAEENGIYIADDVDPWTRSPDMDQWSEVPGAFCFIEEGSTLADTAWVCTSNEGGTIGITAINWSQFAGPGTFSAGTGLTLTGTTFSITNTTVTPAAYGAADKTLTATVNAQGQLTALADTPIAITNSQVSGSAASGTNSDITSLSGITGAIATPTYIDFKNNFVTLPTDATGRVYYDNSDQFQTLVFQMNGSVVQHVGQEQFFRIKCQGAITKGQVVSFAGTVGASGGLIGKAATGLTADQANYILGVADETGADNDWIFVSYFGEVKNIDTTGGAENWIQGQVLYYNPAVTGGLTKNKPNTPNAIAIVAAVVNVGSSNGILFVRPTFGSVLGGTDGNVQFGTLNGGDVIVYDAVDQRWENAAQSALTAGAATNLAGGTAGAVPYQTGAGATTFLALGTSGQVITAGASAPQYTNQSSLSVGTATNLASGVAGAVPYQTGAGATSFSAAGSAGEFLVSGGTGSPTWTATISGGTYS